MKLNETGEFGWIAEIRSRFASLQREGTTGIGDDCAVIPFSGSRSMVVTADMLVEGRHFLKDKISPADLGYKSLAVSLSDVAAMGARPVASFLSVAIDPATDKPWCDAFLEGYHALSARYGVPLLGGDTVAAAPGALTINVTVIGEGETARLKKRNAASEGEVIAITAPLGDSAAGLKLLLSGDEKTYPALAEAHCRPYIFVEEGEWLGTQSGVRAMMDLSDGLISDLGHICEASGCGALIEPEKLPLSAALRTCCEKRGWSAEELALCGGEDYALLLTLEEAAFAPVAAAYTERFGKSLFRVGKTTGGKPGVSCLRKGIITEPEGKGFSHF